MTFIKVVAAKSSKALKTSPDRLRGNPLESRGIFPVLFNPKD
jgi:hypothetical protein